MGMQMPPERLVWMLCSIPADEDNVSSSSVWSLWSAASSLFGGGAPKRSDAPTSQVDPEGFGSGSSELQRIFKRYSASIHALSPMLKAVLCRHLASRALLAGAQTHPLDEDEVLAELLHTTNSVGPSGGAALRTGSGGLSLEKSAAGNGGKEAIRSTPSHTLSLLSHRVLPEVTVLANLFLSASGVELTELKHWVDHPLDLTVNLDASKEEIMEGGARSPFTATNGTSTATPPLSFNPSESIAESYVDMVSVLSLMPPPLRAHILQHIRTEAIVAMSGSRPLLASSPPNSLHEKSAMPWPWPLKVYSDVDDTVQVRLYDCSFPRTTTYPGYVHLMRALRGQKPIHSQSRLGKQGAPPFASQAKSDSIGGGIDAPSPLIHALRARTLDTLKESFVDHPLPVSGLSRHTRGNGLGVIVKEEVAAFAHAAWGTATRASRALQAAAEIAGELSGARGNGGLGGLGKVSRRPTSFPSVYSGTQEQAVGAASTKDHLSPSLLHANEQPAESTASRTQEISPPETLSSVAGADKFSLPRGDLIFLSARPSFMRASTLALSSSIGLEGTAVLCGTLAAALTHTRMAGRKLSNHLIHASCYPEYRFMFVGDSGQADVAFALRMLAAHAHLGDLAAKKNSHGGVNLTPPTPLVLIHDITGPDQLPLTSNLKRAQLRARGVHVFDSYIDAAVLAFSEGLLSEDDLRVVVDGATEDLAGIEFDSATGGGEVSGKSSFDRGPLRGRTHPGGMGGGGGSDFSLQRLQRLQEYQTAMMRAHIVLGKEGVKQKGSTGSAASSKVDDLSVGSDPRGEGVLDDAAIEEALAKEDEEECGM